MPHGSRLQQLFALDSMALSGLLDSQITNEDFVETIGPGAEDLVNLLHAVNMRSSYLQWY